MLVRIAPNRSAFNMPCCVRIVGVLSVKTFERSFQAVVDRHEILRTTYKEVGDKLVQRITTGEKVSLSVSHLENFLDDEQGAAASIHLQEEARTGFDLEQGPVCRARLLRLRTDEHVLIVTVHHIASDGWSQGVLQRDLWSTYSALQEDQEVSLPPLAIQYADFTSWQNDWLSSEQARNTLSSG